MNNQEQVERLEKIRALLAKAEATKFPEEAKLFAAKAQELMTKWSIDEAMLGASRGDDAAASIERSIIWLDANEYRAPKVQVLSAAAVANDCKLVIHSQTYRMVNGKHKRQFSVTIIGTEADRKFTEILYTSLMLQVEHELCRDEVIGQMQLECDQGGHRIKWRNSFVMAYAMEVRRRLLEAKQRIIDQEQKKYQGVNLAVVLVGKSAIVERRMNEFFPDLKKGSKSSAGRGMGSAGQLGREAGARADLGSPKIKNTTKGYIQ